MAIKWPGQIVLPCSVISSFRPTVIWFCMVSGYCHLRERGIACKKNAPRCSNATFHNVPSRLHTHNAVALTHNTLSR